MRLSLLHGALDIWLEELETIVEIVMTFARHKLNTIFFLIIHKISTFATFFLICWELSSNIDLDYVMQNLFSTLKRFNIVFAYVCKVEASYHNSVYLVWNIERVILEYYLFSLIFFIECCKKLQETILLIRLPSICISNTLLILLPSIFISHT